MPHKRLPIFAIFALTIMAGCGGATDFGPIGQITGNITFNGDVVTENTQVVFMQAEKGYAGYGMTDADGNYSIEWRREGTTFDGLPAGTYKVMVQPPPAVDLEDLSADEMLDGGGDVKISIRQFDSKYTRTESSGLAYDIVEGPNVCNIELD